MIRVFEDLDKRRLNANEFSGVAGYDVIFENPAFYKNTLVGANNSVRAIICFTRYWGNCFAAFFLISEDITLRDAIELKKFIQQAVIDFQADRVHTDSVACEKLTRWHNFLGFKSEGIRVKMANDIDYEMWAMLKGRDF
jgi:hypothetical protein